MYYDMVNPDALHDSTIARAMESKEHTRFVARIQAETLADPVLNQAPNIKGEVVLKLARLNAKTSHALFRPTSITFYGDRA